jgi:hypothetical protein
MESGNPEILRKIRKPGTVQNFLAAAEVLRNHPQIHARVFLIIGFPGETYRQILDTIEVVQQMKLDWHNVAILQPLPNTPIFDTMVAEGQLKDYDFKEARFYSGGYNKAVKKSEGGNDLLSTDFKDAFRVLDQSMVPPKEKLDDIWAYMHFHINFKPLFREDRPLKLRQQLTYVDHISDLITPENAFAMYFSGYLQHRVFGAISPETIGHLEQRLGASPYWQTRFEDFGLSVEDLRNSCFQRNSEPLMNENRSFPRELIRNSTSGLQGAE